MNQNIPMKQLMTALEEVKYEQDNSFHFSKEKFQSAHKTEVQNCDLITVRKCGIKQNNKHYLTTVDL